MRTLRARFVLPIASEPIVDGWVAVAGDRIAAAGHERRGPSRVERFEDDQHLGHVALLPGLVNAHTHLELSYLRGLVGPAARFTDWVTRLMALRRTQPDVSAPAILEPMDAAIAEARAAGTAAFGDVGNTLVAVPALRRAGIPATHFHEVLRFRAAGAEDVVQAAVRAIEPWRDDGAVRVSLAPHAPYSVSPRLFQLLRQALARDGFGRTSVHLAEGHEEIELLESGSGPWRDLLERFGAWDADWSPPECGPVEYLDRMRFVGPQTLVVHGVQLGREEIERVAALGATLVTCPRSNRHVGAGDPPVERFYDTGLAVAVGTDSLASAPDLNVFAELAALRRLAPRVPARRLLESATRIGAEALGLGPELGTIEPGRRAALIAVALPGDVTDVDDVEEYLVSGITPEQIAWVA